MSVFISKARLSVFLISFFAIAPIAPLAQQSVSTHAPSAHYPLPLDQPQPLPGPRPTAATIEQWQSRRFGMFIHFGLYSALGGVWQGKNIDNGYSEQIVANAPIPLDQYAASASSFNPARFDPDAIVALAKSAGMKFIVITAKHHDGFNMFATKQTAYNVIDATPYRKDVVKMLSEACARGGLKFGVYYSSIDWHQPGASTYIEGNSNPIPPAHEAFNVAQLKELLGNYGPISEIWFDMGKPTPAQSEHFARTVHNLQPQTMVSGRVFNYQGDFSVMGDNAVPNFVIDEPWQTPASIFSDTWGYRSWESRTDLPGKIRENILSLVEVASRGGNYILNIGPEGDGSVVPYEADVLHGIGQWMAKNSEAIYATSAQPFRKLDFGYATVGKDKLYLFVKSVPQDGTLRMPGLDAANLKSAYLLGSADKTELPIQQNADGAEVSVASLREKLTTGSEPADFLPVIAIPFAGKLKVDSPAIAAGDNRAFSLKAAQADRFYNYNGYGYGAPATLYKLRWTIAAEHGRYTLQIHTKKPENTENPIHLTLFINGVPKHISIGGASSAAKGSAPTAVFIVPRTSAGRAQSTVLEITPAAPFYKGTQLPVDVTEVDVTPAQH